MAKKVATDIVQLYIDDSVDLPFILMDADVVRLTEGMINMAITSLNRLDTLAASAWFYFDPAIKKRFPVLGFVCDIDRKMNAYLIQQGELITILHGFFMNISRKVLATVGGIKVIIANNDQVLQSVPGEDIPLSKDLQHAVGYDEYGFLDFWGINPITNLEEYGYMVYLDASREVYDLMNGKAYDSRWRSEQHYLKVSGTKRHKLTAMDTYTNIPELGAITETNVVKALNRYWKHTYPLPNFLPEAQPFFSQLLLSVLYEFGFTATFSEVQVKDNEWAIEEFTMIEKIK